MRGGMLRNEASFTEWSPNSAPPCEGYGERHGSSAADADVTRIPVQCLGSAAAKHTQATLKPQSHVDEGTTQRGRLLLLSVTWGPLMRPIWINRSVLKRITLLSSQRGKVTVSSGTTWVIDTQLFCPHFPWLATSLQQVVVIIPKTTEVCA